MSKCIQLYWHGSKHSSQCSISKSRTSFACSIAFAHFLSGSRMIFSVKALCLHGSCTNRQSGHMISFADFVTTTHTQYSVHRIEHAWACMHRCVNLRKAISAYDLQALAQDQLRALRQMCAAAFGDDAPHVEVYDGDTVRVCTSFACSVIIVNAVCVVCGCCEQSNLQSPYTAWTLHIAFTGAIFIQLV